MVRKLHHGLIDEAKFCLQQLGSCKDELSIARNYAAYQQTIKILHLLPQILYPKDEEARLKLTYDLSKLKDSMLEEVIIENQR